MSDFIVFSVFFLEYILLTDEEILGNRQSLRGLGAYLLTRFNVCLAGTAFDRFQRLPTAATSVEIGLCDLVITRSG